MDESARSREHLGTFRKEYVGWVRGCPSKRWAVRPVVVPDMLVVLVFCFWCSFLE